MRKTNKLPAALVLVAAATSASAWWGWAAPHAERAAADSGGQMSVPGSAGVYSRVHPYGGYPLGFPYGFGAHAVAPFAYVPYFAMGERPRREWVDLQERLHEGLGERRRALLNRRADGYEAMLAARRELAERQARAYREAVEAFRPAAPAVGGTMPRSRAHPLGAPGSLWQLDRASTRNTPGRLQGDARPQTRPEETAKPRRDLPGQHREALASSAP